MKILGGSPGVGVLGQESGCVCLGRESGASVREFQSRGVSPGVSPGWRGPGVGVLGWEFLGGGSRVGILGQRFRGGGSQVGVLAHFRIYSQMIFMLNNQVSNVIMKWSRPTNQLTNRPSHRQSNLWMDRQSLMQRF